MDSLPSRIDQKSDGKLDSSLSGRERELLVLAAQGFTDQGIAHKLGISLATVGTYWGRVRIKIGPMSRTELVAVYLREQSRTALDELKGRNAELLAQIQEHSKTEQLLKTSLELFRGLLETAPDAILVVSETGAIQLANEQAEIMFGYDRGELLGRSIEDLVPDRYHEAHLVNRQQYNDNPVKRRMGEHLTTFAKRKDESEFPMATALSATKSGDGLLVTCIIRDLTDRLQMLRKQPVG